jgi:hypothetical protein
MYEIKKRKNQINNDYQTLKKLLPNVKSVLTMTERKIVELESQLIVEPVKKEKKVKQVKTEIKTKIEDIKKEEVVVKKRTDNITNLSKLDRIKNNLKIIEDKLRNMN